ncbi:MAG TPA: hypothetical protein VIN09_02190 [Chloroflexota bacterium]
MSDRARDLLRRAAERAATEPSLLASLLRAYRELQGMDEEQLASELECNVADLSRLGLCRRPDPGSARFRADVQRIAAHVGVSPVALARVVRTVSAAGALRSEGQRAEAGQLLAARDREAEPEGSSPGDGPPAASGATPEEGPSTSNPRPAAEGEEA